MVALGGYPHLAFAGPSATCSADRAAQFAQQWGVPKHTTSLADAVHDPETDVVVVALPNHLHGEAVQEAARAARKPVLCTKPLGRTAVEALRMLEAVERAGVFHGYLEDLVYTPKTLKALASVRNGALGRVLWVRSRETHGGPHSDWFWNQELSGGGAYMGCHCDRSFIGKDVRPAEVTCWADTQVHPIEAEDHAVGLVRYENGAIGQFEVSWAFRGGMDLRDDHPPVLNEARPAGRVGAFLGKPPLMALMASHHLTPTPAAR